MGNPIDFANAILKNEKKLKANQKCMYQDTRKKISRKPICLTDSDYDYILEEIVRRKNLF